MKYNFIKTVFADQGDLDSQVLHVISEALEAAQAWNEGHHRNTAEELLDVIHSAETALRILCRMDHTIDLEDIWYAVTSKNRARGYYP